MLKNVSRATPPMRVKQATPMWNWYPFDAHHEHAQKVHHFSTEITWQLRMKVILIYLMMRHLEMEQLVRERERERERESVLVCVCACVCVHVHVCAHTWDRNRWINGSWNWHLLGLVSENYSTILICVHLTEYDWEASHFSKAAANESHDQSLPLHHDNVIVKAVPVQQHNEQLQNRYILTRAYTHV